MHRQTAKYRKITLQTPMWWTRICFREREREFSAENKTVLFPVWSQCVHSPHNKQFPRISSVQTELSSETRLHTSSSSLEREKSEIIIEIKGSWVSPTLAHAEIWVLVGADLGFRPRRDNRLHTALDRVGKLSYSVHSRSA